MTLHYRMLMTCLKYLSSCPCPRCLLLRTKISRIGSKSDTRDRLKLVRVDSETRRKRVDLARRLLFEKGVNITSTRIKDILEGGSLTLTRVCIKFGSLFLTNFLQNAFSERLFSHGFNFYQMFTVDLLHEFELGVWKAIFTHLLRILYAHGNGKIQELNKRYDVMTPYLFITDSIFSYRDVPPFGRDTIRKFSNNVSGLKRLAARDFEDLLQVCYLKLFDILCSDNFSVPFRSSMVCYLKKPTESLVNFCLSWPHGMAWPNCDFIRKPLFKILKIQLLDWGNDFEISRRRYARNIIHMIYRPKRQHAADGRPGKLPHHQLLTFTPTLDPRKTNRYRKRERIK